jgi:hypothetical protein
MQVDVELAEKSFRTYAKPNFCFASLACMVATGFIA